MAYNDLNDKGNSAKYRTNKKCIEPGCNNFAGTAWSPFWCVACNIKRIDKINKSWHDLMNAVKKEK